MTAFPPESPLPAQPRATEPSAMPEIDVWVFDLDNTLYPADCNLFEQVDRRMGEYIAKTLGVELAEAKRLQKQYFRDHGTTLNGLMTVHDLPPEPYLDYVHDIDLSPVDPSPRLDRALAALEGRKIILTNGTVAHAERVAGRLGVLGHFDHISDIVAAGFVPKPQRHPYDALVARAGIAADRAILFEDMAKNLLPAHDLGMTTAWVRTAHAWAAPVPGSGHVHHVIDDLVAWLEGVAAARAD